MWIKVKNGELFNLNYADNIYKYRMKSGLYAVCLRKKIFSESEKIEFIPIKTGLSEKEAEEEIENLLINLM
jgi:hypothetical protein